MSTGFAARPGRREGAVEPRDRVRRQCRKGAAEVDQPVDREHADAAAVGQDGETLARKGLLPPERFGRGEELVEVEHAQEPGAPKGGLIDGVRAGERAGVRRRRPRALRVPARLDHDDRLRARRGARRRHELAGVGDRLDVEQDRPGAAVGGEIVEAVAEIDVDHVAERDQRPRSRPGAAPPIRRSPAATAPDWEISARSPGVAFRAAKLALSFAGGAITPRQFGPTRRRPCLRASIRAASASEPAP